METKIVAIEEYCTDNHFVLELNASQIELLKFLDKNNLLNDEIGFWVVKETVKI